MEFKFVCRNDSKVYEKSNISESKKAVLLRLKMMILKDFCLNCYRNFELEYCIKCPLLFDNIEKIFEKVH